MIKRLNGLSLLLLVGVLAVCGCGEDKPANTSAATTSDTPKALVVNFIKAVENHDTALFLDNLKYDKKDEDMVVAMFDLLCAMQALQSKAIDAYGEDGAVVLIEDKDPFPTQADIDEKIRFEEEGDTAKAYMEGKDEPLEMVKIEGVWKADLPMNSTPPDDEQRQQAIKMIGVMSQVHQNAADKIGKEGYTAEKIKGEMDAEMKAMMMKMMEEAQK